MATDGSARRRRTRSSRSRSGSDLVVLVCSTTARRHASRPRRTRRRAQGRRDKRAEILLDRQVALLIEDNRVVRTIAVSTGKPSTPTPPGDYRVYAKIPRWWSTPFREWLPWALPFVGGIAFHQLADVPDVPGVARLCPPVRDRRPVDIQLRVVGMPVKVLARS